jgi:hypothetical protein
MICGRRSTLFNRAQELGMVHEDRTTGLPCFEISDHDSRIKLHPDQIAERQGPVILGDVIDHPRLFTAYPFLKEIKVVATPGGIDSCGTNGRQIFMRHPFPQSLDYQGAILHEIQHIIQGAEGFSIGSNPAFFLEGMEMTPVVSLAHLLVKQTDHSGFWNKVEEIALTEYGPQCLGELQKARSIGRSDPETDNKGMPEVPAVVESFVREARQCSHKIVVD